MQKSNDVELLVQLVVFGLIPEYPRVQLSLLAPGGADISS